MTAQQQVKTYLVNKIKPAKDKSLNKIKDQLVAEIESLKTRQGYVLAGVPRFKGLFGRDSLIVAWQLLPYDSQIARDTLKFLAKFQGKKEDLKTEEEPGKILHEYYDKNISEKWWRKWKKEFDWLKKGKPYYNAEDSTIWFLVVVGQYFLQTKDEEFVKSIWPNVKQAIDWVFNYGDADKDEFLEAQVRDPKIPSYPSWIEGWPGIKEPVAPANLQGLTFFAYQKIEELCRLVGDKDLASVLKKKSLRIKKKFNQKFWMSDKKYFCSALDGEKKQVKQVASSPGELLFTGILDKGKEKLVIKKIFSPELWTPFGIRILSNQDPAFDPRSYFLGSIWPHSNWIIAQGLKSLGYKKEYQKIKTALLKAFKTMGFLPEFYGVVDNKICLKMKDPICYPQAWSSGALLNFLN